MKAYRPNNLDSANYTRDGAQTTSSSFEKFLTPPSPPPKNPRSIFEKKEGGYLPAGSYVTKEHWLSLIFAIFYERNTVQ